MVKDVFIRADGSPLIGLGHIIRCLALAHMIKSDFNITFFSKEIPENLVKTLILNGFSFKKIIEESDFFNKLSGNELVVLDNYELGFDYQKKIKEYGCKLICIDDLHEKEFFADLIINHAPGIFPEDYIAQDFTEFALGLDYVLLRPNFIEASMEKGERENSGNLFISFGGSDPRDLSVTAVEAALETGKFKKIHIVLGQGVRNVKHLCDFSKNDPSIKVYHSLNEVEILEVMKKSDVALVPASGILLEALAAGCKIIFGMYVENQRHVYNHFKDLKVFSDAKNFEKEDIKAALNLNSIGHTKNLHIDGKSPKRITGIFQSFLVEPKLVLREANLKDLALTYKWASNQELRKYSFINKKISFEEHKEWLEIKVKKSECIYLIGELEKEIIGSVRYDILESDAIISYLLDPNFQGKGLGMVILKKGFEYLRKLQIPSLKRVVGYVMLENIASQKSFRRLGYIEEFQEGEKRLKYTKQFT